MTGRGENSLINMMKYFIAIVFLSCFIANYAAADDLCVQIPLRTLDTLKNASVNLTDYNFSIQQDWSRDVNISLTSLEHEFTIDHKSLKCVNFYNTLNVMFEISIENFYLDGHLITKKGFDSMSADFRAFGLGKLTLKIDALYMEKTKKLLVKNQSKSLDLQFWSDYEWSGKVSGELENVQVNTRDWVNSLLSSQFPDEFNYRAHSIIFANAANITGDV